MIEGKTDVCSGKLNTDYLRLCFRQLFVLLYRTDIWTRFVVGGCGCETVKGAIFV